jgi:hypothetical protein
MKGWFLKKAARLKVHILMYDPKTREKSFPPREELQRSLLKGDRIEAGWFEKSITAC